MVRTSENFQIQTQDILWNLFYQLALHNELIETKKGVLNERGLFQYLMCKEGADAEGLVFLSFLKSGFISKKAFLQESPSWDNS